MSHFQVFRTVKTKTFLADRKDITSRRQRGKKGGEKAKENEPKKIGTFNNKKSPNFGLCAYAKVKYCTFDSGI